MVEQLEIFPWNENFVCGIDAIDEQHKKLVELLNTLVSHIAFLADSPELERVFAELKDYAAHHFATEEEIWQRYLADDAWSLWHKKAHDDFIDKTLAIHAKQTPHNHEAVIEELVTFLTHWLAMHIIEADKRMAKVVLALPTGLSLEQAKALANSEMSGATRVLIDTVMGMYDKLAKRTVQMTREISRRVKAEQELVAAQQELLRLKDLAEAASQSKSAFLANMSHEIRTPLGGILGLAHLIQRDGLSTAQAAQLDTLRASGEHLLRVVNGILDLSKIEAGKLELKGDRVDVARIVGDVAAMIRGQALAKDLEVSWEVDGLPEGLVGDATRLQQALLNYAANAVQHSDAGSVALRAAVIDEDADSALLRFEVRDTGVGVEPALVPRLFSAFAQADHAPRRPSGGTGLGLAITQEIARLMGGDAGADSRPGAGSTFWFTARLRKAATPAPQADAALAAAGADAVLRRDYAGARILVAEDEPINREVARLLLEAVGLHVATADNGAAAVELAREGDFAMILMDMQMPVLDGLEATAHIRQLPQHRATPIVAMTANVFAEDRQRCLDAGMDDFITKPIVPQVVYARLAAWLGRRAQR